MREHVARRTQAGMQNKAVRNFVPEFRIEISNSPDTKWRNGPENDQIEIQFGLDKL